jgi:carbon-monoxide dehydrogenase small subunit
LARIPRQIITLNVNGQDHAVAAAPHHTLCEVLRYDLQLTGTKQGCDKGDCGACTVLVDGEPILSCLTLASAQAQAPDEDGKSPRGPRITTIEGLARPEGLDPVQNAFDQCGALQCGFCQPGMMLSARALLDENPKPTLDQIREALSGNLCRCTGYTKILEAVLMAAIHEENPEEGADEAYEKMRAGGLAVAPFEEGPGGKRGAP